MPPPFNPPAGSAAFPDGETGVRGRFAPPRVVKWGRDGKEEKDERMDPQVLSLQTRVFSQVSSQQERSHPVSVIAVAITGLAITFLVVQIVCLLCVVKLRDSRKQG